MLMSKIGPVRKNEFAFLVTIASNFTRAHHASVVDQNVYTTRFSENSIDDALATLFVGDIQDDLPETQSAYIQVSP